MLFLQLKNVAKVKKYFTETFFSLLLQNKNVSTKKKKEHWMSLTGLLTFFV